MKPGSCKYAEFILNNYCITDFLYYCMLISLVLITNPTHPQMCVKQLQEQPL